MFVFLPYTCTGGRIGHTYVAAYKVTTKCEILYFESLIANQSLQVTTILSREKMHIDILKWQQYGMIGSGVFQKVGFSNLVHGFFFTTFDLLFIDGKVTSRVLLPCHFTNTPSIWRVFKLNLICKCNSLWWLCKL